MNFRNVLVVVASMTAAFCPIPLLRGGVGSLTFSSLLPSSTSKKKVGKGGGGNAGGRWGTVAITTTSLPSGSVGTSYSASLTASGGKTPYTWSLIQNQLPPGLALASSSGVISGVPTASGQFGFTVQVADSRGSTASASLSISIAGVQSALLSANPTSMDFASVTVGTSSQQTLTLSSTGTASVTISLISVSGDGFSATSPTLPLTLSPGQSSSLTVTFAPAVTGSLTGSVSVASDSTNSPLTVALSGSGITVQHSVDLSWSASTSVVSGYNVYRSSTSGGPYTKVNSSLLSTTSFSDATVQAGQSYFYVTTAVDANNAESVYSNEVSATVPSP
jgi:hypothetical protein